MEKGEDYSYLIDVLNKDSVVYRMILVNGNIAPSGIAALKELNKQRVSDIQLQIFWKESLVIENMMMVYAIVHPRQIILQHWNNFLFLLINRYNILEFAPAGSGKKYNQFGDLKKYTGIPFTIQQLIYNYISTISSACAKEITFCNVLDFGEFKRDIWLLVQ